MKPQISEDLFRMLSELSRRIERLERGIPIPVGDGTPAFIPSVAQAYWDKTNKQLWVWDDDNGWSYSAPFTTL